MEHNGNGEIPFTGDPRVDAALKRIWGKFRDLDDTMIVQAHLEKRLDERGREHAEWLKDHQTVLQSHQESVKRHERAVARHDLAMVEIDEKLNALIDIHEQSTQEFDRRLQEFDHRLEASTARHNLAMQEIEGKLNGLIDIVDRMQRGEAR